MSVRVQSHSRDIDSEHPEERMGVTPNRSLDALEVLVCEVAQGRSRESNPPVVPGGVKSSS